MHSRLRHDTPRYPVAKNERESASATGIYSITWHQFEGHLLCSFVFRREWTLTIFFSFINCVIYTSNRSLFEAISTRIGSADRPFSLNCSLSLLTFSLILSRRSPSPMTAPLVAFSLSFPLSQVMHEIVCVRWWKPLSKRSLLRYTGPSILAAFGS